MKKILLISMTAILLSSAVTPKTLPKEPQGCTLKIGSSYSGGIVFSLSPGGGCHGLVCAPNDQSQYMPWNNAVAMCKSLKLNGYSYWRLPYPPELDQMFTNLYKAGLGHFAIKFYWSSVTQSDGACALGKVFADRSIGGGQVYCAGVNNECAVRAVHAF